MVVAVVEIVIRRRERIIFGASYVSPTLLSALLKFSHLLNEEVKFQKGKQLS